MNYEKCFKRGCFRGGRSMCPRESTSSVIVLAGRRLSTGMRREDQEPGFERVAGRSLPGRVDREIIYSSKSSMLLNHQMAAFGRLSSVYIIRFKPHSVNWLGSCVNWLGPESHPPLRYLRGLGRWGRSWLANRAYLDQTVHRKSLKMHHRAIRYCVHSRKKLCFKGMCLRQPPDSCK